jgi:hypothetical protein
VISSGDGTAVQPQNIPHREWISLFSYPKYNQVLSRAQAMWTKADQVIK